MGFGSESGVRARVGVRVGAEVGVGVGVGVRVAVGVKGKVRATAHQLGRRPAELAQPPLVRAEPCAVRHHEDTRLVTMQLE